ncbi:hypothetical protein IIA15_10680 [candidate division TA06 bacterium]|nr:hypothetical protein [candidate division TA06 bacterium]
MPSYALTSYGRRRPSFALLQLGVCGGQASNKPSFAFLRFVASEGRLLMSPPTLK